jgi:glucan phosphoethanolaminetransferase (alkaline phosphatase superfamily)
MFILGSLTYPAIGFIFPVIFYVKTLRNKQASLEKTKAWGVLILISVLYAMGVAAFIYDKMNKVKALPKIKSF